MSAMDKQLQVQAWPARMCATLAAAYLDISLSAFRDRVRTRTYPQPVRDGGKVYWARMQLDHFIASQFGLSQHSTDKIGDESWADLK
jgi:predicted DNA-binding transcriptional regulator AlpA